MSKIEKGDYVLATKYEDGDPGDNWAVGFYDCPAGLDRHLIVDGEGKQLRASGFRRVGRITQEYGKWLLSAAEVLERSPPGTVNLWTMATPLARGQDEEPVGRYGGV